MSDLTFYGGEPLLSVDLIVSMSERLQVACAAQGTEYSFNLVTNGTLLTRKIVERLLPLGLTGAKVTLDGPRENHDRFGPSCREKGPSTRSSPIVKDVCDLIRHPGWGELYPGELPGFPAAPGYSSGRGTHPGADSNVQFAPVTKTGGDYPLPEFNDGCASTDEPWLMEASIFLREEILKRGYQTPGGARSLHDRIAVTTWWSIMTAPSSNAPPSSAGRKWRSARLAAGIGDYAASHGLDLWKTDECLDCAYLPLCFGGCRLLTLLRNDAIDDVDCRKAYLDATLEGVVRQDLRYQPRRRAGDVLNTVIDIRHGINDHKEDTR